MHYNRSSVLGVCGRGVAHESDKGKRVKGHAVVRPGSVVVLVHGVHLLVALKTMI